MKNRTEKTMHAKKSRLRCKLSKQLMPIFLLVVSMALPSVQAAVNTLRVNGGTDRVVVPNAPALNPGGAITIEAWVRQTTDTGCQTIVGKNFFTGYWFGLCSGKIRYYAGQGAFEDGAATIPVGQWTHIAVTYNRSTLKFYINGIVDLSVPVVTPLPVNLDDLGIGGEASFTCFGSTCPFTGNLAEVRLWRIARVEDDIRRDIVKQIESPRSGLVAVWSLEGGPEEVFGSFNGSVDGSATFTGQIAPPVGEEPLQIPRILEPILDGRCDGLNGPLRIPVWNDNVPQLEWLYLGATATDLWVCMENVPSGGSFVGVYVDPTNDATFFANPDDFRLRLQEGGDFFSEAGTGVGGYSGFGPAGAEGQWFFDGEFQWKAEFRIPRSLLEMGPDNTFGLQVIDDQDNGDLISQDWGWPVEYFWDWPAKYQSVVINDVLIPTPDTENPNIRDLYHVPRNPPAGTVRLLGSARDTNGVSSITLFLDRGPLLGRGPIKTCDFDQTGNYTVTCFSDEELAPGRHHFHMTATDTAGRTTISQVDSFRVLVDGASPELTIISDPIEPLADGSAVITATATDPSGITYIEIGTERCNFSGTNSEEICTLTVMAGGQRVRNVIARTGDNEGFNTQKTKRIIFGNTGQDSDGDGLVDDIEDLLCTSKNNPDSDGDSLLDKWEIFGVSFPDGDFVNLPDMGANPCRKDVFLQYDYEVGARVGNGVIENIVAAYQRNGITLHVEENERPRPQLGPVSNLEAAAAGAMLDDNGEYYFPPKHNWTHYYAYSRHSPGRSSAGYRFINYDIYVGSDDCECPLTGIDPATCGLSNEAVDTQCYRENVFSQTSRFMHELGHSVGLGHGGRKNVSNVPAMVGEYLYYPGDWDNTNLKPNYRSLMNYGYPGGDLCITPNGNITATFNYSGQILGNLNENALDERATSGMATAMGFWDCPMAVPGSTPLVAYTCADSDENTSFDLDLNARRAVVWTNGIQAQWRRMHGANADDTGWNTGTPNGIDWNCDGAINASVSENVNGVGEFFLPSPQEICGDGLDNNDNDEIDENCSWSVSGSPLRADNIDWLNIPRPAGCMVPYSTSRCCYPQNAAYRSEIDASVGLDCRPNGQLTGDCPLQSGSNCPDTEAPAHRGGTTVEEALVESDFLDFPPATEFCDGQDNDGDLIVDEGCRDSDLDEVADAIDNCPTVANVSQSDMDGDFLGDSCDSLVIGPLTVTVQGDIALDIDWDDVPGAIGYNVYKSTDGGESAFQNSNQQYPGTGNSVWLDIPPLPGQILNWQYRVYAVDANGNEGAFSEGGFSTDDDVDGVANANDNCLLVANPGQQDADADNFGNACDTDFNNDCITNFVDISLFVPAFQTINDEYDINSDGAVNFVDYFAVVSRFLQAPGPSGTGGSCNGP